MPFIPSTHGSFPVPPPRTPRSTVPRILQDPHLPGLLNELNRAREALDQSRAVTECLVNALDELHLGIALHEILTDETDQPIDYRFLQVNAGFERLTGLTRSQLVGHTVQECFPSTDSSWIAIYGRVALGGERLCFEAIAGRCGRVFEISAFQAGPLRFALVFQDVTAIRELEGALAKSRASFRQLAESAGDMIFVVSGRRLLYANLACSMISGYSLDELDRLGLEGLLVPEERNTYLEMLSRFAQEEGYCTRREFRIATREGEIRLIGLGARPIDWEGIPAVLHFAVELPSDTAPKTSNPKTEAPKATTAPLIVLVDDEPQLLGLSQRILLRHGFRTRTFISPVPALLVWNEAGAGPDLVVTDIDMPEMNGFDFYRQVRSIRPEQKFLFVTGSPARSRECPDEIRRENGLLMKPFSSEALVQAVSRRLELPSEPCSRVTHL